VASEPLQLVSYSFWRSDDVPAPYQPKVKGSGTNGVRIDPALKDKIYGEIRRIMDRPELPLSEEMSLAFDIGMDSLNIGDMIAFLSHHYEVGEIHPEDLSTVQSVLEIAQGARVGETKAPVSTRQHWPEETGRPEPVLPYGKTVPEGFLHSCERLGSRAASADDLVGVFSYKKMKRAALVLAQAFKNLEGDYVGVMLPASCGAFLAILGLQLAGKIPVMLNWTLGPRYLDEMMKASGARVVISSWRFLERLNHVDFSDELIDRLVMLEDVKEKLSLGQKLKGAYLSLLGTQSILEKMGLSDLDENRPCVVLFTSGTEAVPKGVPLTHKNIMTNLRSGTQCIDIRAQDVMYGVLPPFHSFGFTVTGLFPLFVGMRVAFYPDPTDSFALAEGIERWQGTYFCAPPSFLKGLLAAAKPEQVKSIRYFVSGAEKLPADLPDRIAKINPKSRLIEGYGITECSPILTISRHNLPPKGVGQLLPDLELCTIHPETLELLPTGSEGEICVRGPSVFNGYLGKPRDPFIEIHGKRWYRTGDLGRLDPDGSLILSGRLKRFTKVGGEMISLGAVEEIIIAELIRRGAITADLPALAVCCDEKVPGKPQLIVFTTVGLDRDEANEILKTSGFSRLVKISSVHKVEEIPLMGSGKTDYRRLQSTIA
jgi:long-chain-fatty-acid--[acyl-carrier-protein] ligase